MDKKKRIELGLEPEDVKAWDKLRHQAYLKASQIAKLGYNVQVSEGISQNGKQCITITIERKTT